MRGAVEEARQHAGVDLKVALQETFSEDKVSQYMAIRTVNLKKAINEDAIKSSIETGKGTYTKIAGERFTKMEKPVFNLPENALDVPEVMPKYGFIASKNRIDAPGILDNKYGESYIKLKPEVRQRSTITLGDSYDGNSWGKIAPAEPLTDIGEEAVANHRIYRGLMGDDPTLYRRDMAKWAQTKNHKDLLRAVRSGPYVETQVFGKLGLDDIAEIMVQSKKDKAAIEALLKKKGYGHIPVVSSGHHDRLYKIIHGHIDAIDSFTPDDIDRLGTAYIDKVFRYSGADGLLATGWDHRIPAHLAPYRDKVLAAKARGGPVPEADVRDYLKEYFRLTAQKEKGGLPKVLWRDFKSTHAGFTADVLDPTLLQAYPAG